MASSGRLPGASREYSQSSENAFRGDLQRSLSSIGSKLDEILSGRDADLSKIIHSTNYSTLPVGVSGPEEGAVTEVATGTGLTGGPITSIGTVAATGTLADVAGLSVSNGNFVVGDGANFVAESGSTARTSMGCGTGDGTVDTSGTPVANDYARFTDANTIEGIAPSYLTAYRTFDPGLLTRGILGFTSGEVWVSDEDGDVVGSLPDIPTWDSSNKSSDWTEGGTYDGEFAYAGDTRKFLITWHMSMWYFLKNQYTSLIGGVFLKPDGGSWPATPVVGSAQVSNLFYDYAFGLYYVSVKAISGSAVVEIEDGDEIRLQFGFLVQSGTNTDAAGIVWIYGSGSMLVDDIPGMTINIVPVT